MADTFPPTIAPQTDSSSSAPEPAQQPIDTPEPVPITEQEVGEYREQDRYLPVSLLAPTHLLFLNAPVPTFVTTATATASIPVPAARTPRLQMCRVS